MLQEIKIKNFKSIAEDTIQLGRVNVFIGENGCGKSNLLEAVGFASASDRGKVNHEDLIDKGIRVAKPLLTVSAFGTKKQQKKIEFSLKYSDEQISNFVLSPDKESEISSSWTDVNIINSFKVIETFYKDLSNKQVTGEDANTMIEALGHVLASTKKGTNTDSLQQLSNSIFQALVSFLPIRQNNHLDLLSNYLIYGLNTLALRGFINESNKEPLGIYGENLDVLIANFDEEENEKLRKYNYLIDWLSDFFVDMQDTLRLKGYKLNRSKSTLYFTDKYMLKKNNIFSSENANEGILHVLFYLVVMISKRTPKFFAIDNIESCLNPHLCRHLMEQICVLAKQENKQLLITTHNPAILDGLNLFDDEIRLFEVKRNDNGHTKTRRIKLKPEVENEMGEKYKLSELWTRGFLGAIPQNF